MYRCPNWWPIHFYVDSTMDDGNVLVRSWFLQANDNPLAEQHLISQPGQVASMELGLRTLKEEDIEIKNTSIWTYSDKPFDISEEERRVKEYTMKHGIYDLLTNNSEHFVTFIKTGKSECKKFKPLEHIILQQLIILSGHYGFIPTVLAAIRLGVMKVLASFLEIVSSRVIHKAIEKTTEAVTNIALDVLVVNVSGKGIDQIIEESAKEIIEVLSKEISKSTDGVVSDQVIQNSLEVLCREILTKVICQLAGDDTDNLAKNLTDRIAKEGLDVVTKEVIKTGMENLAKELLQKGIIEIETDFFEYLVEESVAEDDMKEILQTSKMAAIEQLSDEVVKSSTTSTAYHVVKNATKSNITVGVVVEGVFYTAGIVNASQKYYKGEMDGTHFVQYTVEHTASAGGSLAGGIGGSLAGAAAGASIGSIFPVVGTTIGAGVGGFIGAMGGGVGGSLAGLGMGKMINWMWK